MILSVTGFSYLLLSIGLGVLSFRCFETWNSQRENRSAQIFLFFFSIFTLNIFLMGNISLFGAYQNFTRIGLIVTYALDALGCATLAFLIFHLRSRKSNPWYGFIVIFILGMTATTLNYIQGKPYVTNDGGVVFGISSFGYILTSLLFVFTFLPMMVIFFQQFKLSSNSFLKTKSFMFVLLSIFGFAVPWNEFFLEPFFNLEQTPLNEIALIGLNITLYALLLTRQLQSGFDLIGYKLFKKNGN